MSIIIIFFQIAVILLVCYLWFFVSDGTTQLRSYKIILFLASVVICAVFGYGLITGNDSIIHIILFSIWGIYSGYRLGKIFG